jgi:hypothetical protein
VKRTIDQDEEHRACWDMISWLINGTASQADADRVLAHAGQCAECREELAFQRQLAHAVASRDEVRGDVDAAWMRMQACLPQEAAETRRAHGAQTERKPHAAWAWWHRMREGRTWLGWGLALQSVVLALVTVLWLDARPEAHLNARGGSGAPYATLSAPAAAPTMADIRVVLSPALTLADVRKLVQGAGLRIVDINDEGTIFGLKAVDSEPAGGADMAERLARLRGHPGVLLAEPVVHDGGHEGGHDGEHEDGPRP